jgi:uncharacterized protein
MRKPGTGGFDYAGLVAVALRGVVREVLRKVASDGLVGEQHLYLSFRTTAPGLEVPSSLRRQFPEEMTIVLQNQFWGLAVDDDAFSVQLKFGGRLEQLTVPFDALVAFADPSVPFGLRFEQSGSLEPDDEPATAPPPADPQGPEAPSRTGAEKVVAFRSPRKKPGPRRLDS